MRRPAGGGGGGAPPALCCKDIAVTLRPFAGGKFRFAALAAAALLNLALAACSTDASMPVAHAPPAPPPVAAAPRLVPSTPNQVAAEILRWFRAAGYKPFQAEAMADHASLESGFRPCAAGPGGLRYTYQWGGLRLQRLNSFAATAGGCPPLAKQLAFADRELRGNPAFACFWQATTRESAAAALRRGFGRGSC